jgi:BRCT domain type II-containing protein
MSYRIPSRKKPHVKTEPDDDKGGVDEDSRGPAAGSNTKKSAPLKKTVNIKTFSNTIPKGKPNCLEGLRILFTGTFAAMDRKTSVATAIKYGAEVVTRLEDTDYIVVGLRAGPKKLQVINEMELETINEEEFFDLLKNGVSEEKRERMAARRAADEAEEEEDEAPPPKKRSRK